MFGNLLFPGLILMALTMVVSFYHTYGSMRLMKPGNDWEKGIPSDPYPNAPKDLQMVKNNIKNLFEYPIIFYALLILIYTLDKSDMPFIYLSWIYVLLRIIHSFYHDLNHGKQHMCNHQEDQQMEDMEITQIDISITINFR